MLALTFKHPWAWAILKAEPRPKRIENRVWAPHPSHIHKWHCIHGGRVPTGKDYREARADLEWIADRGLAPHVDRPDAFLPGLAPHVDLSETFLPGLVGMFRINRVVQDPYGGVAALDPWFTGPFGWAFDGVFAFDEPIACPGSLGFWTVPPSIALRIEAQYGDRMK